jgi:hypothetical protein
VPGQPLPLLGACAHYRHSHRWLRFPCCGRRFPCDLCHELGAPDGHEMAWAKRMVRRAAAAAARRGPRTRRPQDMPTRCALPIPRSGRMASLPGPTTLLRPHNLASLTPLACADAPPQRPQTCGYCGVEQAVADSCKACGKKLASSASNPTGKATRFWEGGKGQRDPSSMSRKGGRAQPGAARESGGGCCASRGRQGTPGPLAAWGGHVSGC